jgi:hypothetical protein
MDEKKLTSLCFVIIIFGFLLFIIFYAEEFPKTTISELIKNPETKGKLFGRVDYIISNENNTIFIFVQDQSIKVFYPKKIDLKKNDFVQIYAESTIYKNTPEIFAHKVIKE